MRWHGFSSCQPSQLDPLDLGGRERGRLDAKMAETSLPNPPSAPQADRDTEFGILLEASEAAATHTLDFDALMVALETVVRKIVDYEIYSLLLPNDEGELSVAHSVGYGEDLARSIRLPPGQGLTGEAVRRKETVRVDDVSREPGYVCKIPTVKSELSVPLVARGKVVAVLDLQSAVPEAFDSRVSALLELVASRFSLAIDVAQLYRAQAKQHSTLHTLQQIAQEFSQILHLDELLGQISTLIRPLMPYDVFAIYLTASPERTLRHYFGVKYQERVQWRDIPFGAGLVGSAAAAREPVLVKDTSLDSRYIESTPGIRSEVAIPLIVRNQVIGVLDLESAELARFTNEDVHTLTLLAPQIATAIENARLYEELERDLVAARSVQRHLLPTAWNGRPGIEIAARNEPASVVSGDFYDYFDRGGEVAILNGDVSGKGAAAALYAALASGLIRAAAQRDLPPGATLGQANEALLDRKVDARFLAALLAVWDAPRNQLTMAAAGMPAPYVLRNGRLSRVELEGFPLGLFRGATYEDVTLELQPGDLAVTFTDGFNETVNTDGATYGDDRLEEVLRSHQNDSAQVILDRLFDDVSRFCEHCPQADDRTAVVLRVTQ